MAKGLWGPFGRLAEACLAAMGVCAALAALLLAGAMFVAALGCH